MADLWVAVRVGQLVELLADKWVALMVDQMAAEMVHHLVARKVVLKAELWVRLSDRQQEFSSFDG